MARMTFRRVSAASFETAVQHAAQQSRHGRRVSETLTTYSRDEYATMRCYLSADRLSGYAVRPDADLVSVFNVSGERRGDALVQSALHNGARKLDAFDEGGFLPNLYGAHGFIEYHREQWDAQYAPRPWSGGTPDVVYMRFEDE